MDSDININNIVDKEKYYIKTKVLILLGINKFINILIILFKLKLYKLNSTALNF